jgi:hypothetical protein
VNLNKLCSLALLSLATLASSSLSSNDAKAADSPVCTINQVVWTNSGKVVFWCDNVIYYAFATGDVPSGCPVTNLDARKQWYSTAQSALLSGRTVFFANYTTCGTHRTVTEMTLTSQ